MSGCFKSPDALCFFLFECTKDGNYESLDETFARLHATQPGKVGLYLRHKDDQGRSMFHWACYHGHFKIIKLIIRLGYVDLSNDMFGYSGLDLAIIHGHSGPISTQSQRMQAKIVQKLVEVGLKIILNQKGDFNSLHWACYNDNFVLVSYLMRQEDQLLFEKTSDDLFPIDMIFRNYKDASRKRNQNQIFTFLMRWYMFKCGTCESPPGNVHTSIRPPQQRLCSSGMNDLGLMDSEPVSQVPYSRKSRKHDTLTSPESSQKNSVTRYRTTNIEDRPKLQLQTRANKVYIRPVINGSFIEELPEQENGGWEVNPQEPNPEVHERWQFEILHDHTQLTIHQELELRFLYWSSFTGNVDFVCFCLSRKANPFMLDQDQQAALHIGALNGQNAVLKIILDAEYRYAAEAKEEFSMTQAINIMSGITPASALHLAVEKEHLQTIILLLCYGCSFDQVNFRTLTPFELTKEKKITEYYYSKLKPMDPLNFVEQGFYYVLKAPAQKSSDDCIVRIQLMNIKETCRSFDLGFDFILLHSSDRKKVSDSFFYYVIRVPEETLSFWADELELRCFNLKQGIISKYNIKEHQDFERFKDLQIQTIIQYLLNREFDVNVFVQERLLLAQFPLHNHAMCEKINIFWNQEQWSSLIDPFRRQTNPQSLRPLHAIASYYGPKVGWYFAFLCQFTTWLLIPTIPGICIGLYMVITSQFATALMPLYSIFMNIWATIFLEGWKRRESELAFFWDMHEFQQTEQARYQYQGQYHINSITNRIQIKAGISAFSKRLVMDGPVVLLGLCILFANFILFRSVTGDLKGNRIALVAVGSANGVSINVLAFLYREICKKVVEWENHEYHSKMEMSYVFKIFVFEFFNSYLTPGYQAIESGDYELLTITVGSIIITRGLIHNTLVNILPIFKYLYDKKNYFREHDDYLHKHRQQPTPVRTKLRKQSTMQKFIEDEAFTFVDSDLADQSQCSVRLNVKQLLSLQERLEFNNVMLDNKELIDEYMYLAIQFGYITMFSPVFPIAPLFAMINIYVNLRLSLYTYQNLMKREPGEPADGIGIWINIFTAMNYFSTVMNCIVIYTTSKVQLAVLIGPGEPIRDAFFLFAVEHIILCVKYFFDVAIPDIPEWVVRAKKRYVWLEQRVFDLHLKRTE